MHPNPAFRKVEDARNIAFARDRAFGMLTVNAADGPLISHVPFALNESGTIADLHLVRSNPILRMLDAPMPALIAVAGPDAYVSPDWYDTPDQVPTWNYVAVHLRGTLEKLPQDAMRDMLDMQSAVYEKRLTPKTPWTADKMTPEVLDKMMRQIVPYRLTVASINGTWKLGQNKPDAVRVAAADAMHSSDIGSEVAALADLMRDPPQD
ncbi:FMN-binding negative transcriptional regulator [Yoonia sp. 208BN28-4]|uniref:FMN-binding negative transcriptional regulator n=1 Tax=Yoonia sp. 208BN28-4 TaxID=3126505 RepID=UPI0030ACE193